MHISAGDKGDTLCNFAPVFMLPGAPHIMNMGALPIHQRVLIKVELNCILEDRIIKLTNGLWDSGGTGEEEG